LADSWWKRGGIYHICPGLYVDAGGDGRGDIGDIGRLDDPAGLGLNAVFIAPFSSCIADSRAERRRPALRQADYGRPSPQRGASAWTQAHFNVGADRLSARGAWDGPHDQ
jgi:hypothetical protein